jgi:hypothetical protein
MSYGNEENVLALKRLGYIYQQSQISENFGPPAARLYKEASLCTLILICLPPLFY